MKQNKIRVFLIDDHPTMREGVRAYLTSHSIAVVPCCAPLDEKFPKDLCKAILPGSFCLV